MTCLAMLPKNGGVFLMVTFCVRIRLASHCGRRTLPMMRHEYADAQLRHDNRGRQSAIYEELRPRSR